MNRKPGQAHLASNKLQTGIAKVKEINFYWQSSYFLFCSANHFLVDNVNFLYLTFQNNGVKL